MESLTKTPKIEQDVLLVGGPYDGQIVVTDQKHKLSFTTVTKCGDSCGKKKVRIHSYFINGGKAYYEVPEVV